MIAHLYCQRPVIQVGYKFPMLEEFLERVEKRVGKREGEGRLNLEQEVDQLVQLILVSLMQLLSQQLSKAMAVSYYYEMQNRVQEIAPRMDSQSTQTHANARNFSFMDTQMFEEQSDTQFYTEGVSFENNIFSDFRKSYLNELNDSFDPRPQIHNITYSDQSASFSLLSKRNTSILDQSGESTPRKETTSILITNDILDLMEPQQQIKAWNPHEYFNKNPIKPRGDKTENIVSPCISALPSPTKIQPIVAEDTVNTDYTMPYDLHRLAHSFIKSSFRDLLQ